MVETRALGWRGGGWLKYASFGMECFVDEWLAELMLVESCDFSDAPFKINESSADEIRESLISVF